MKTFFIFGVKVSIGQFGAKIYTRDEQVFRRISLYLMEEGFKVECVIGVKA